ncbi:bifunctional folylpolyglutamate synthase/dihydrofolate synthase [Sphingomonas yunnanensis]|uniref:bifunctional folylpolyglutamate synthase/dihydrofolate synthase n=1 Tax=Sphingomonas yunnanensis TaxID=310400 RepID=UPI001CA6D750|nr:bifunctional folylpolyglutamate synthase/dihydrofolate synthase [Sphingomonas yunnanensis]MBY9062075.1 bifunctional folylpolyglutamate synthase/dihydrofolate synthase [Sphingomonas yunnanensis]
MADHAVSADPRVQAQLDRLWALSPGADVLGLERITRLLARLGDPQRHLPPVFHVAGTNGKGSTCAYLRAALEAAGHRVHAYTSPHLVRFNERVRLAGRLIADDALAALLAEVLDRAGDLGASFFEVTTAAAFLAFARTPADACVIEVGLGGRLDATNVVPAPLVCGIAALGIDHQAFLGDTLAQIAAEKAGIAKPGTPLVTMRYPPEAAAPVARAAAAAGAPLLVEGEAWRHRVTDSAVELSDRRGTVTLPLPALPGAHQAHNLALAAAMLRAQDRLGLDEAALAAAARGARWPARLQRLAAGRLTAPLGATPVWLDGGHNESAGRALGAALDRVAGAGEARSLAVVLGMLANKDPRGLLAPIAHRVGLFVALPVPGHAHHDPADLAALAREMGVPAAATAGSITEAVAAVANAVAAPAAVLVLGSLYLAGEVLSANDELPD